MTALGSYQMSELDIRALEANFDGWRNERAPNLSKGTAFELYAIEQILKDADLSDEEIESGVVGGPDDGGIDGFYFFVNRTLIQDETDLPDPALTAQLFIIQAKYEPGFGETSVEKMHSFARDLLDFSKPVDRLTYLNSRAKDAIARFREKYDAILGSRHTFTVSFRYGTKSDAAPNAKVQKRIENLTAFVKTQVSAAEVEFECWGCVKLLAAARTPTKRTLSIEISRHFTTDEGAVVCLVRLKSFAAFLTDDHGDIRRSILEPNVRDYQGKANPVNKDIRKTLKNGETKEFWWLNNGITVLGAQCSISGNKLVIDTPEIVNGLQTSQEIFSFFKENPSKPDDRTVLVRVVVPPDEQTRFKIIKATNFQTPVNSVSLRATDAIHFDIEERFKLYQLFYDRRKGEYRNLRKPITQIVSIRNLARAVIAIVLQQPNDARARPQSLLNKDETYNEIFSPDTNRDVFVACILIDRQVLEFLKEKSGLTKDEQTDTRYYVDLWLTCGLLQKVKPTAQEIASLTPTSVSPIPESLLENACDQVQAIYKELGGTDKVAKGTELVERIIEKLTTIFPS